MTFETILKKTTDGNLYLEIPNDLSWQIDDQLELTVMTDLDTDSPCVLIVNQSEIERTKNSQIDL